MCFAASLVSTKVQCVSENKFSNITNFCHIFEENSDKSEKRLYYDHFLIFFKKLWKKKIIFIFFELAEIFLSFMSNFFTMIIIQLLSPEYLICSRYWKNHSLISSVI